MADNDDDIRMFPPPGPLPTDSVLGRRKRSLVGGGSAEAGPSGTATASQIQQRDEGSGSRLPQSKRLRNATTPPPRTKAAMKEKKRKERRPGDWHLMKKDIPKGAKGFKVCS